MKACAEPTNIDEILPWRDRYRKEMDTQIVHDSMHARLGWTQPYRLSIGGHMVGYASVLIGGPWSGKPTAFEFFVSPEYRMCVFDLFTVFLKASGAGMLRAQSNDPFMSVMLFSFGKFTTSERILFCDGITTDLSLEGVSVRAVTPADAAEMSELDLDAEAGWVIESEGAIAGSGGVMHHYNPPYGDLYMAVGKPFRRRGYGSFLVQELKRICYEQGRVPAARCDPNNIASRQTLQKAGFVPCGHILSASVGNLPGTL